MKLFSLLVLYKLSGPSSSPGNSNTGQARLLKSASELNSFGFFQRGSVEEFMKFTAKIITERTPLGERSSVKEQDYIAHVYVRGDSLSAVLVSDQEYPKRVAHTLLNKVQIYLFRLFSIHNCIKFIWFVF
jgi:synaptobrevin homolog YKT6